MNKNDGLTLDEYSDAKKLPTEILKKNYISDCIYKGKKCVQFEYRDRKGRVFATRIRTSMNGDRFRWKPGAEPRPYGLWRLDRKVSYLLVLEGESDSLTAWAYGFNAIGLPGVAFWKDDALEKIISGFDKIIVVIEPDDGGAKLLKKIRQSRFRNKIFTIRFVKEKDVSELYLSDPEGFKEKMQEMMDTASPVDKITVQASINDGQNYDSIFNRVQEVMKEEDAYKKLLTDCDLIQTIAGLKQRKRREFELLMNDLKDSGMKARDFERLRGVINHAAKRPNSEQALMQCDDPIKLAEFLPDAPMADLLNMVPGYRIDFDGVFGLVSEGKDKRISTSPVIITERFVDLFDDTERFELSYYRNDGWQKIIVGRGIIADMQKIVSLADFGFPVTSRTARDLVGYLQLLESLNLSVLPVSLISSNLGWQGRDCRKGFLLGARHVRPKSANRLDDDDEKAAQPVKLKFIGNDAGDVQIAGSYYRRGNQKECKRVLEMVSDYPVPMFMMAASMAAPLLHILDHGSFTVDLNGRTTIGKTTCLQLSAFIWGNPNLGQPDSVLRSWNSTVVHIERVLSLLNGLPLFLDDSKLASKPEFLSKVVYGSSFGMGRGRGSILGTARTGSWRTVILSTGEQRLTDLVKRGDGGAHARVLPVSLLPFGETSAEISHLISKLQSVISSNYGIPSRVFVSFLVNNSQLWSTWRRHFRKLTARYRDGSHKSGVVARLAPHMACIHLAAKLANSVFRIEWDVKRHMATVWESIAFDVAKSSNLAMAALDWVVSQSKARQDHFWSHSAKYDIRQPLHGWLGAWTEKGDLAIISSELHKMLEAREYEAFSIIREWASKGWLKKSGESKGLTRKVVIGDQRTRCYVIKHRILKKV